MESDTLILFNNQFQYMYVNKSTKSKDPGNEVLNPKFSSLSLLLKEVKYRLIIDKH